MRNRTPLLLAAVSMAAVSAASVAASAQATCALGSGQSRMAMNGTTVCAPHTSSLHVTSDCCDWNTGICYAPSAADRTCGSSTSGSTSGGGTASGGRTSGGSTSGACAMTAGLTRMASNNTTVCAPHPASPHNAGSDCCDWWSGNCFPASAADRACGAATTGGTSAPPSTPPPSTPPPATPPPSTGAGPTIAGCQMFPADNAWNEDVSTAAVDPNSATYINAMGARIGLHMDFGTDPTYGIPFQVVTNATPTSTVSFMYSDESDHVGYPIPTNPLIEGGNDHHILMLNSDTCVLYELFSASHGSGGWSAGSGAMWELNQDWTRPVGWTSADEAGLAILPGLIRYDEVASGAINHALRFTVSSSQNGFVAPATHVGSNSDTTLPPMGLRVRLRASVNVAAYPANEQVILRALQRYGMIVADDGGPWYVSGVSDARWSDDDLHTLDSVLGSQFEVVRMGPILHTQ